MKLVHELNKLIEAKKVKFALNGDGMTNVHPKIDSVKQDKDGYHFVMTQKEFDKYLKTNKIKVDSFKIVDPEDGYEFGEVSPK